MLSAGLPEVIALAGPIAKAFVAQARMRSRPPGSTLADFAKTLVTVAQTNGAVQAQLQSALAADEAAVVAHEAAAV